MSIAPLTTVRKKSPNGRAAHVWRMYVLGRGVFPPRTRIEDSRDISLPQTKTHRGTKRLKLSTHRVQSSSLLSALLPALSLSLSLVFLPPSSGRNCLVIPPHVSHGAPCSDRFMYAAHSDSSGSKRFWDMSVKAKMTGQVRRRTLIRAKGDSCVANVLASHTFVVGERAG